MPLRLSAATGDFGETFENFAQRRRDVAENVAGVVSDIIADVRTSGDAAVVDYTQKFDRLDVSGGLRMAPDLIVAARDACLPRQIDALEIAATRIRAFHERQRPEGLSYTDDDGVRLGARWTPVSAAGIYVPGGSAAYPSSCLLYTSDADDE